MTKAFDKLSDFILNQMRMSHIYQPVMLIEILKKNQRNIISVIRKKTSVMHQKTSVMDQKQNQRNTAKNQRMGLAGNRRNKTGIKNTAYEKTA